jgi:hypothetical protein
MRNEPTHPRAAGGDQPVATTIQKCEIIDQVVRPIYPVRYAYANFFDDTPVVPATPPPLKELLFNTEVKQGQGYLARLLRPGWIYIREEDGPDGYFHIFKYEHHEQGNSVTERYSKHQFTNGINAQGGLTEDGSSYPFVFVRKEVTKISIAYSEHKWHADVIDTMNGDAAERAAAMQLINLQAEDYATVEATSENLKTLVEDYRDNQDRLLDLQDSSDEPSLEKVSLDLLTTQNSYKLDPQHVAAELQRKSQYGEVARIVGLFDPVGRQRDIAEVHAKLALWQKQFASTNLYPYTIGEILKNLKESDNNDLQKLLGKSINWEEHKDYWQDLKNETDLFQVRLEQFANLFKAFMIDSSLTGQVGSLDTYFTKFYCRDPQSDEDRNKELQKLCETVGAVFNGILSSQPGRLVVEEIHSDFENEENAYYAIFKNVFKGLVSPQNDIDWGIASARSFDKVLKQLGVFWGEMHSLSEYSAKQAHRLGNKGMASANTYLHSNLMPRVFDVFGISVTPEHKITFTTEQLGKILADFIAEGAEHFPGTNPGKVLDKAEGRLQTFQKLFDWGQSTMQNKVPNQWKASKVNITRAASGRYRLIVPDNVTEGLGIMADGTFSGLSAFFNVKTIWDLMHQTQFDTNNPLTGGSRYRDMIQLTSSITALTADTLTIARAAVGVGARAVTQISARTAYSFAGALAPKLLGKAEQLGAILASRLVSGLLAVANLAAAIDAFWNARISYQQGNMKEMAGHIMLGAGSVILFALAGKAFLAGVSASTVTMGAAAIAGTIAALLLVIGGFIMVMVYGKSDFQVLLENCFWGKGRMYLFMDDKLERAQIQLRLKWATRVTKSQNVMTSYQLELQEFMNYLYQPKLELKEDAPFWATNGDHRTYTYSFSLPDFKPGVSEILCSVRTRGFIPQDKNGNDPFRNGQMGLAGSFAYIHDDVVTDKFTQTIKRLIDGNASTTRDDITFTQQDGFAEIQIVFETNQQIELHWHYQPQPGVITPRRYLTKDGLIDQPIIGMIDEEPV